VTVPLDHPNPQGYEGDHPGDILPLHGGYGRSEEVDRPVHDSLPHLLTTGGASRPYFKRQALALDHTVFPRVQTGHQFYA